MRVPDHRALVEVGLDVEPFISYNITNILYYTIIQHNCIYIYIYIYREREIDHNMCMCVYIFSFLFSLSLSVYIYIYVYVSFLER